MEKKKESPEGKLSRKKDSSMVKSISDVSTSFDQARKGTKGKGSRRIPVRKRKGEEGKERESFQGSSNGFSTHSTKFGVFTSTIGERKKKGPRGVIQLWGRALKLVESCDLEGRLSNAKIAGKTKDHQLFEQEEEQFCASLGGTTLQEL